MRLLTLALVGLLPIAAGAQIAAHVQAVNYFPAGSVSTTPSQVIGDGVAPAFYLRIWNVSPTGGATVWCTRFGSNPQPNTGGSFSVMPGQFEIWNAGGMSGSGLRDNGPIPKGPLWCRSDAGTAQLTAEGN